KMAAGLKNVLDENVREKVQLSRILVVGAGGIGCELIKNLVLTGFCDLEVIDLDTIDVSNLNRQFLFRKEHVGKSKAKVARESALSFNPDAKIVAHHDSVMSAEYGTEYFKQFSLVMNALDNRAARNHVNRMCLAADVPLVESGTAGYLGQVTVIKKGLTECYECQPKPTQKTFPGCTIRNTPSEPIHCIVWAKHLFNQLFGEEDPDQDVSPDTEDPELTGGAGEKALGSEAKNSIGGIERKSTRGWAAETGYDTVKLFNKLFRDDIKYLLSMDKLWKKRRPPTPLDWDKLPSTEFVDGPIRDQQLWSVQQCADILNNSIKSLKDQLAAQGEGGTLVWDKDDSPAMDFVTCAANIRAYIFGIPLKSRFDIKSMAGNIIPAIATTNAVIAALIVMEGMKILSGAIETCKTIYLNRQPNVRKKLLVPCFLDKPNPKCYVCSAKPEVTVKVNTTTLTLKTLEEKIIKGQFNMVAPDVEIDDGKGTILISSEEGETDDAENMARFLNTFGIISGTRLKCDDFLQEYKLNITILHEEELDDQKEFEVIGDLDELQPKAGPSQEENTETKNGNGTATSEQKQSQSSVQDEEDDLMVLEDDDSTPAPSIDRKRKADSNEDTPTLKKPKTDNASEENKNNSEIEEIMII
ncbi:unnamed protein product, partial [Owenia fusiformis]